MLKKTVNKIAEFRKIFNFDFAFLTLFVFVINLPYLKIGFLPVADTLFTFNNFYFFYNEWFFNGRLAHWMPYGSYGLPSSYWQITLSPMSYISMILGKFLMIKNVLLLFKISMLGEQLIFLAGMYLLCKLLFSRRSVVFLTCLSAVGSIVWYSQIGFNFRIFYLFPLVSYCFLLFFLRKKTEFFWLGCLVALTWLIGNSPYFAGLWFFVFLLFFLVLFLKNRKSWRYLFKIDRSSFIYFLIFVIFFGVYCYFVKNSTNFISALTRGPSGRNELDVFLTYGGNPTLLMLLKSFFFADPVFLPLASNFDNTVSIGLASLIFFIWAVLFVRKQNFLVFLLPAIALMWFSFGGIFSRIIYLLPAMPFYRHIGLIFGLEKILIVICAGFGLENFLLTPFRKKMFYLILIGLFIVFLFDISSRSQNEAPNMWYFHTSLGDLFKNMRISGLFFRFFVYLLSALLFAIACFTIFITYKVRKRKTPRAIFDAFAIAVLVMAYFLDMYSFQRAVLEQIPKLPDTYNSFLDCVMVSKLSFQEQRIFAKGPGPPYPQLNERQSHAYALVTLPRSVAYYVPSYNFIQLDSSVMEFRVDLIMSNVYNLIDVLTQRKEDQTVNSILGRYYPKLRLAQNVFFTNSTEEALDAVRKLPTATDVVVLTDKADSKPFSQKQNSSGEAMLGNIKVLDFSANELIADVAVESSGGAWLIYADAFHPGWKATINGKKIPIFEAYGAFKAIHLEQGIHGVRFYFYYKAFSSYILALFGVISGIILLIIFLLNFRGRPPKDHIPSY